MALQNADHLFGNGRCAGQARRFHTGQVDEAGCAFRLADDEIPGVHIGTDACKVADGLAEADVRHAAACGRADKGQPGGGEMCIRDSVAIDGRYAGCLLIADVVKPHSAEAIRALKAAGVRKTVMLTGDAEPVAKAVSAQLGLDEYHAGLLPGDKVDQIETLIAAKKSKENLAFVGDGINDAPVLSRADVGIAMGALGSDLSLIHI